MTPEFQAFRSLMETRRTLRNYRGSPITEEEKRLILDTARLAPTAGNMSLYSMIEITDAETKRRLAQLNANQTFLAESSFVVLFVADYQRWYDFFATEGVPQMCLDHDLPWRSPEESDLLLASCDALIAAQTAVLAAETLGIGSCYFGTAIGHWEEQRNLLQLPTLAFPVTLLAFGRWADEKRPAQRERLPLSMLWHKDKWRATSDEELELMATSGKRWSVTSIGAPAETLGQKVYLRKIIAPFAIESARATGAALQAWLNAEVEEIDEEESNSVAENLL